MIRYRNCCVYCDSSHIVEIFKIKNMPLFMGSVEDLQEFEFSDMTFLSCEVCNAIFLKELVDPHIVYQNNHNRPVVGKTWQNHYLRFVEFIGEVTNKDIVEIGDPSLKVAKFILDFCNSYTIIEPNPDINNSKVKVLNQYFDEEFHTTLQYDVIINSHFIEHLLNPKVMLKKMNKLLVEDGLLIFSIPNLEYLLENKFIVTNILQFEHTYFFSVNSMERLLNICGFEVIRVEKYLNHSLFFKAKKIQTKMQFEFKEDDRFRMIFSQIFQETKTRIEFLNKSISSHKNNNIYLFGCHVSSQFLISLGLRIDRILNILDNSPDKEHQYLYGTNIESQLPNIICKVDSPLIICSHMSIYFDEVKSQLLSLNKNATVI